MTITGSTLARTIILALAGSFVAAIAVGRMSAPEPRLRGAASPRFLGIPARGEARADSDLQLVDLETGDPRPLVMPAGEELFNPSCAPWRDASGGTQIVGGWRKGSGRGASRVTSEFGLARVAMPEGRTLDRIASEIVPEGAPCWFPGTGAKVLFAASDGGLYRFAFEGVTGPDASASGGDLRPWPILWKVAPPGEDERSVRIYDPEWPGGKSLDGRLLVTLCYQVRREGRLRLSTPRPWLLKLDAAGEAIEEATPLVEGLEPPDVKVRMPRIDHGEDGRDRLVYLARRPGQDSWDLCLATLAPVEGGALRLEGPPLHLIEAESAFAAPAFSTDGKWVYYVPSDPKIAGVLRIPSRPAGVLARGPEAAPRPESAP